MSEPAATRAMTSKPAAPRKIRVAVVFGGRSSEHAVSCSTAASVLEALDRSRYDVVPIGIAKDGRWVLAPDDPQPLRLTAEQTPEVDGDGIGVIVPTSVADRTLEVREAGAPPRTLGEVDVVLPLLHGPFGEDGTLQGLLDLADVRYVGSGVAASAAMMDKALMKIVLDSAGLPMTPHVVITDREWHRDKGAAMNAVAALGWPVFVKPARAGSSIGIVRVTSREGLEAAIDTAREHDPKVVVEAAVSGREIECGVLDGRGSNRPRPSRLGECVVVRNHDFYDYDAKYLSVGDVRLECPADLPLETTATVQEMAVRAFEAAGCEGLARVDFFVRDDGEILVNEVNTMPGFTPHSMYPRMWAATGLSYPELVDELIALALARRTGLR
jgi:D-alanine-D-alanine ligase